MSDTELIFAREQPEVLAILERNGTLERYRLSCVAGIRRALIWRAELALPSKILTYRPRIRYGMKKPEIPFGWWWIRDVDLNGRKDSFIIGPWWVIAPLRARQWWLWHRWDLEVLAFRRGLMFGSELDYIHTWRWRFPWRAR